MFFSYFLIISKEFIRICLRHLKHHLLIIIFTIPVHIEIRMSGKIYISSTALVKSGKSRPKLRLFSVYMHAKR